MKKETKNQIGLALFWIILIISGFLIYRYLDQPTIPVVGESGEISGYYSIGGIMRLGRPYVCNFRKDDGTSSILGVIHTDESNLYGEFKIKSDLLTHGFDSYLIINKNKAYTWTSLQNIGYESKVAKSATQNATPEEQAQIVGLRDKINYECSPWSETDPTLFETPGWVTFSELK